MTGPSARALPDMMEKAVARMDRIYTDALAAGVLPTDRYLVLEKPVEKEDLPEETIAEVPAGEVDASVTPPVAQPDVVSFTVTCASLYVGPGEAHEIATAGKHAFPQTQATEAVRERES